MSPVTLFLVLAFIAAAFATGYFANLYLALVLLAAAVLIASSLRMADVWRELVILRLGKLLSVRRAHLFPISPVADSVLAWLRTRYRDGRSRERVDRAGPRGGYSRGRSACHGHAAFEWPPVPFGTAHWTMPFGTVSVMLRRFARL